MKHAMVVKSNLLIEASYKLSAQEQWVILTLTSKIRNDDEDFKDYRISVREFAEIAGIRHKGEYQEIKEITKSLIGRVFTINEPSGHLQISWLSSAKYLEGEGTVALSFDPKLKPYLLQLKERFTKYSLHIAVRLKSSFSIRIYELLKQYERVRERTFFLDDLKSMLGIQENQYALYGHFKAKILKVAQEELEEKTDISFDFEEIKVGRSVGKLRFFIKSKAIQESELERAEDISPVPQEDQTFEKLVVLLPPLYRTKESVRKILKDWLQKKGFDYVTRNIEYANDGSNAVNPGTSVGRGSNYRVYLSKALAGDFGLPYKEDNEARLKAEAEGQQRAKEEAKAQKEQEAQTEKEREDLERARIYQESLSPEALENLKAEAVSRLSQAQCELLNKKIPGSGLMLKMAMSKICLERMKIS